MRKRTHKSPLQQAHLKAEQGDAAMQISMATAERSNEEMSGQRNICICMYSLPSAMVVRMRKKEHVLSIFESDARAELDVYRRPRNKPEEVRNAAVIESEGERRRRCPTPPPHPLELASLDGCIPTARLEPCRC